MLSLQGPLPEVNFQDKSEGAYDKLLQIVEAHIPEVTQSSQEAMPSSEKDNKPKNEEQKSKSFQVGHKLVAFGFQSVNTSDFMC